MTEFEGAVDLIGDKLAELDRFRESISTKGETIPTDYVDGVTPAMVFQSALVGAISSLLTNQSLVQVLKQPAHRDSQCSKMLDFAVNMTKLWKERCVS